LDSNCNCERDIEKMKVAYIDWEEMIDYDVLKELITNYIADDDEMFLEMMKPGRIFRMEYEFPDKPLKILFEIVNKGKK
jgi:hypothetical protein